VENDELMQRAQFGREVELFWGSRIGQYLRERATECYTSAIQELETVDPTDVKRIIKLQSDIFKAKSFDTWLSEVVTDGLKSLDLLEGESGNAD
jgi:hypothetical protein